MNGRRFIIIVWVVVVFCGALALTVSSSRAREAKEASLINRTHALAAQADRIAIDNIENQVSRMHKHVDASRLAEVLTLQTVRAGLEASSFASFSATAPQPIEAFQSSGLLVQRANVKVRTSNLHGIGRWLKEFHDDESSWRAVSCSLSLAESSTNAELSITMESLWER